VADRTESRIVVQARPADVLNVIADFASYPRWTGAVREATVVHTGVDGRAEQVRFVLDTRALRDEYTLAYRWQIAGDGQGELTWSLVRAQVLTAMDGSYRLAAVPGGTEVTYTLTVDLRLPILGMLRRKAEKVIIDTALSELKRHVEG